MRNIWIMPIIVMVVALVLSGGSVVYSSTSGTDGISVQRDSRPAPSSTDGALSWTKVMENTWNREKAPTVLLAKRFHKRGFYRGQRAGFYVRHPRRAFWNYGYGGWPVYGYTYPYVYGTYVYPGRVRIYGDYGGYCSYGYGC